MQNNLNQYNKRKVEELLIANKNNYANVNTTKKPILIILFGPPASGKGSHKTKAVIESMGYPISKYINIDIDVLVESVPSYIESSKQLILMFFKLYLRNCFQ